MSDYPRDMIGYGRQFPDARWPGQARIAVQFVINYEEGGENCILHGDAASEAFLSEIVGAAPWPGQRHMNMESIYEYGSRAGFWRLHRMFTERHMPVTVFAIATALARNPEAVAGMKDAGWEIASHGLKWIDYKDVDAETERRHIREAIDLHTRVTGTPPQGFYQGRSSEQTIPLATAEGHFLYFADAYADDLPYWIDAHGRQELIVPYTLDANDMRFATPQGFNSGDQFFSYLKDSFDYLYAEGTDSPKMLSIGLHCRLVGRPGRAAALARFLDYVQSHERVWVARRIDIARHWIKTHPPKGGHKPSQMALPVFLELYGDIFEHTPQIAERAHRAGLGSSEDTASGLHTALVKAMHAMDNGEKLKLIRAHPDLAGRLAVAKQLTADSTKEQSSAGLDQLSPDELKHFTNINDAYRSKFGFPFIMAVKGATKEQILAGFEQRIGNSVEAETETALSQIERIAALRLADRLPQ
ncbi:OHCU decarboxylase [Beijerinckia sp. GAS462]|nr:OHCU decarboxylase [Beijerinckia sp. GAS462]SEC32204.1 OHCU decarboxylase [Beijerinckia sp. 28-YEA-48]